MKYLQVDQEFLDKLKSYAVFIPLIEVDGKDHILFEVRSNSVSQPGEVSFPGGKLEDGEDFREAAIRETIEELGLKESDIEYLGYSSMILTSSYRHIKSFYGRINKHLQEIKYNNEVESIFTVDIDFLKIIHRFPIWHLIEWIFLKIFLLIRFLTARIISFKPVIMKCFSMIPSR